MGKVLAIVTLFFLISLVGFVGFVHGATCPSYVCSPWSVCVNNTQTRVCTASENTLIGTNDTSSCGIPTEPAQSLPCDIMASNLSCQKSNVQAEYDPNGIYGDNPYVRGHLVDVSQHADYWDTCTNLDSPDLSQGWLPTQNGSYLMEYYCNGSNYQYHPEYCSNGCINGACVIPCVDGGRNYYTPSSAVGYGDNETSFCETNTTLREYYCRTDTSGIASDEYLCPFGCSNGACLRLSPSNNSQPIDINQTIQQNIPDPTLNQQVLQNLNYTQVCQGCVLNDQCYPFGFRINGAYCSYVNSTFVNQNAPNSACQNNFECNSNLCINNSCVSGNLWSKIMQWFSHLFGG